MIETAATLDKIERQTDQSKSTENENYQLLYKIFNQMKIILEPENNREAKTPCRYYQQRRCRFGRSCRNLHINTSDSTPERTTSPEEHPRL